MNKLIREGRFGAPKTGKTYSVVSTYPKPLIVLNFDEGGLDGILEPITYVKPTELETYCKKDRKDLPPICCVDFCDTQKKTITQQYVPTANDVPFQEFIKAANLLVTSGCPWQTVVLDSITGVTDIILSHISKTQMAAMQDPRKWASMAGGKIAQIMGAITSLDAHAVFIFHETQKENEKTSVTSIRPLVHSQFRDRVGGLLSQWFYACKENGKYMIRTSDYGLVTGIGARWPQNLAEKISPPDFKNIYGDLK